jgi:hypothetical protein
MVMPNQINSDSEISVNNLIATYYYSNKENKYLQIYPNYQDFSNYKKSLQEGSDEYIYLIQSPVWFYSDKSGVIKYDSVYNFPKFDSTSKLHLSSGWNFVTINPLMVGKPIEGVKGDCSYLKAYAYSSDEGWLNMLNLQENIPEDAAGQGIVIKVSSDCKLDFGSNSSINLPILP